MAAILRRLGREYRYGSALALLRKEADISHRLEREHRSGSALALRRKEADRLRHDLALEPLFLEKTVISRIRRSGPERVSRCCTTRPATSWVRRKGGLCPSCRPC